MGPLKFLTLLYLHARRSDPDRPSGISPCGNFRLMFVFSVCCLVSRQCHKISIIISASDSSVWASATLTAWPPVLIALTRLKSLQEGATSLWPRGFSVYASRLLFTHRAGFKTRPERSASRARLDTGGWLILTRPGLSPGKKRQASLDALTFSFHKLFVSRFTAASARIHPSPDIHACKRRGARVPSSVGLEPLWLTRRRDWLQAIGAW